VIRATDQRTTRIDRPKTATVQLIFKRYTEIGSVALLKAELDRLGIVSRRREGASGQLACVNGCPAGALYLML